MPINNRWIKVGAINAALAVVLGTIAIEVLSSQTVKGPPDGSLQYLGDAMTASVGVSSFEKAALLYLIHALAIVAAGILMILHPGRMLTASAWCFQLGALFYSGPVYLQALVGGFPWSSMVSLVGVVLWVAGWIALVEGGCPGRARCDVS